MLAAAGFADVLGLGEDVAGLAVGELPQNVVVTFRNRDGERVRYQALVILDLAEVEDKGAFALHVLDDASAIESSWNDSTRT